MSRNPGKLYTEVWPDYAVRQARDLFWYERLWKALLAPLGSPRGRHLLDWGTGPGFLVSMAQRLGWNAWGYDPAQEAWELAQAHGNTRTGTGTPPPAQDVVVCTEVLEHLEDPLAALQEIISYIRPGGHLALSVPNDDNPLQILQNVRSQPWVHHTHLHYFNPASIRRLVQEAGLEVVWQRTSCPTEPFLALPIPRNTAWKLSRVWPAPPLLWRLGIGRHNLLIARRGTRDS